MNKEKFREEAKKGIDELFDQIEELISKKVELKEKSKAKYNKIMAEIKQIEADLEAKYKRWEESGDNKWTEAKEAFSKSAESFREAFKHLASLFKSSPPSDKKDDAES
jgi:hypothetical protein